MIKVRWGTPEHHVNMRFRRGYRTYSPRYHGAEPEQLPHGNQYHVRKMYGISFGGRFFLGILAFDPRGLYNYREDIHE